LARQPLGDRREGRIGSASGEGNDPSYGSFQVATLSLMYEIEHIEIARIHSAREK
jgi:hypothetical protein